LIEGRVENRAFRLKIPRHKINQLIPTIQYNKNWKIISAIVVNPLQSHDNFVDVKGIWISSCNALINNEPIVLIDENG